MILARLFLLLAFVTMGLAMRPARAQVDSREGIALQNEIAELRQEVQALQAQGGGAAPAPAYVPPQAAGAAPAGGGITSDLLVRVGQLEEQVRQLQGRVDDLTNALQRQNDALSKQISDLGFQLQQGGGGAGQAAAPASPGAPTMVPALPSLTAPGTRPPAGAPATVPAVPPRRTPEIALKQGQAALARGDYVAAEAAAREVLAGKSPRAADARFLLARALSGQRSHQQAAAEYYAAYSAAPKSRRAPEALLGVAQSLIALNDGKDACQALAKLHAEFPTAVKPGYAAARRQAACP